MPVGLLILRPSGETVLDWTTRTGQFLGWVDTNGQQTGSVSDPRFIGRELCAFARPTIADSPYGGPVVTLNKATGVMSWEFPLTYSGALSPNADHRSYRITYGVY